MPPLIIFQSEGMISMYETSEGKEIKAIMLTVGELINVFNKFEDKVDEQHLSVLDEIEQELMNVSTVVAYESESEV